VPEYHQFWPTRTKYVHFLSHKPIKWAFEDFKRFGPVGISKYWLLFYCVCLLLLVFTGLACWKVWGTLSWAISVDSKGSSKHHTGYWMSLPIACGRPDVREDQKRNAYKILVGIRGMVSLGVWGRLKQSSPATRHGGAWGERRYCSYSFLTSALDGGEWSTSRPDRAMPRGKDPRYPLYRRLDGPQSWSGHRG
jgi:hypothetical protein